MTDLVELAKRVEALDGPCRETDGAIDRLCHDRPKHGDYDPSERAIWRVTDGWSGLLVRGDGFARGSFSAAEYTESLNAAISLADGMSDAQVWRIWNAALRNCSKAEADMRKGLPRYLTAACLRALATQGEG